MKSCRRAKGNIYPVLTFVAVLTLLSGLFSVNEALGATAAEIDASVNTALQQFNHNVWGGKDLVEKAAGVLVFHKVLKAGFGIGGQYGEGALRIGSKSQEYYSLAGASFGFQLGAQKRSIIIAFMNKEALTRFEQVSGWKIGGDLSVALVSVGASGGIDTMTQNQPVVAVIFGEKGLMYNLTLEGSKVTKLEKEK